MSKTFKMQELNSLLDDIKKARAALSGHLYGLDNDQGRLKCTPETWSLQEIVEHLVLAERGGFDLIYTAAEKYREGFPVWQGESENTGLSIEKIIEKTWKPRENAPDSAWPGGKWSLGVWLAHFRNCDDLLGNLPEVLQGLPPEKVIYPHFLCGPLNVIQRLEFIRFHIERHSNQVMELKNALGYR